MTWDRFVLHCHSLFLLSLTYDTTLSALDLIYRIRLRRRRRIVCADQFAKVSIRLRPRSMPSSILPTSSASSVAGSSYGARAYPGGRGYDYGGGMMPRSERGMPVMLRRLTKFKSMVRLTTRDRKHKGVGTSAWSIWLVRQLGKRLN